MQREYGAGRIAARGSLLLAVLFVAALSAPSGWGQCRESDFPGREGPIAAPTRPIQSSSPDPVQTGVVQVEAGWLHTWFEHDAGADAFSNLFKLGAWCNAEVRWSMNSYARVGNGMTSSWGMGDNLFTAQYRILREAKHLPSTAFGYTVKAGTADSWSGLGSGKTDHAVTLMMGKSVHGFSNIFNASLISIGRVGGSDQKGEWTFATSHALKRKFAFIAEIYGDSALNSANDAYVNTTWVLNYLHSPRLVFDLGTSQPLTSGLCAPGKAFFAGVTYAIGDAYRHHRR